MSEVVNLASMSILGPELGKEHVITFSPPGSAQCTCGWKITRQEFPTGEQAGAQILAHFFDVQRRSHVH